MGNKDYLIPGELYTLCFKHYNKDTIAAINLITNKYHWIKNPNENPVVLMYLASIRQTVFDWGEIFFWNNKQICINLLEYEHTRIS